jgi:putative SbcD/Mre11-related phosphoesterase
MRYLNRIEDTGCMPKEISLPFGIRLSAGHAIYCRDDDALAIADLHLGYEASLQAEHVTIPRFQMEPMLEKLAGLLARFTPQLLIINGDLKHEFSHNKKQEWDEVETLLDALAEVEVVVVRGNHDNYLQTILARKNIRMVDFFSITDGKIVFQHGHKNFDHGKKFQIFAHEHPVIRFRDEVGAQVTLPCFLYDEKNEFLVMPAFSPLASGTNVISPEANFMNPALKGLDMSNARVFAIHEGLMDFGKVGGLRELRDESYLDKMKDRNTRM